MIAAWRSLKMMESLCLAGAKIMEIFAAPYRPHTQLNIIAGAYTQ